MTFKQTMHRTARIIQRMTKKRSNEGPIPSIIIEFNQRQTFLAKTLCDNFRDDYSKCIWCIIEKVSYRR